MNDIAMKVIRRRSLWAKSGGDFARGMTAAYNAVLKDILGLDEEQIKNIEQDEERTRLHTLRGEMARSDDAQQQGASD